MTTAHHAILYGGPRDGAELALPEAGDNGPALYLSFPKPDGPGVMTEERVDSPGYEYVRSPKPARGTWRYDYVPKAKT